MLMCQMLFSKSLVVMVEQCFWQHGWLESHQTCRFSPRVQHPISDESEEKSRTKTKASCCVISMIFRQIGSDSSGRIGGCGGSGNLGGIQPVSDQKKSFQVKPNVDRSTSADPDRCIRYLDNLEKEIFSPLVQFCWRWRPAFASEQHFVLHHNFVV